MKNSLSLLFAAFLFSAGVKANTGDTTWVQCFNGQFTHYGNYDTAVQMPGGTATYRKIYLIFTMGEYNCPGGATYCHQWDYTIDNTIMTPHGDTFEMARFISPYATSGTPGFPSNWKQHYIFDVSDFYPMLKDSVTMRVGYSGYSWGFTGDVKLAFIEGTPERNVAGHSALWNGYYTYGNLSNPIDSNVKPYQLTAPDSAQTAELKLIITGHGADSANNCCEFSNNGQTYFYDVISNGNDIIHQGMDINCGWSELYPQGGTWLLFRSGNWCPGGLVSLAQYRLPGISGGNPFSVDVNFDDSYNGLNHFGGYAIAGSVFYYKGFNKNLDASLEDVIAPTNFEWYRRENPRSSVPVVKVRNTGATAITSLLFQYGVADSVPQQYIWMGTLAPLQDTIINLPQLNALTNLSLNGSSGNYKFVAQLLQVNGRQDNDPSNDTITSYFSVAPTWPAQFAVNLMTSSIGASGSLGVSPSDAGWQITDQNNHVVASRTNPDVSTQYKDTVNLFSAGFYTLTVTASQCYGLQWWALAGSSGYSPGNLKVWDVNNLVNLPLSGDVYTGGYHDDFGCGFTQYFTTSGQCAAGIPTISRIGDSLYTAPGQAGYQWYYNGRTVNGATGPTLGITHNDGNYYVVVNYGGGCFATSTSYPVINLSTTDLTDVSGIKISPNPAINVFGLQVNSSMIGAPYTLTDLTGREMLSGDVLNNFTNISVAGFSPGVYLLNVGGQNHESFKIVKQ